MSADWSTRTVQQLQEEGVLLVEDGNHGEYRPRPNEFVSQGVAFIRAADMDDGQILFSTASRIDETAFARIRKGIGKPGDILLSHKGTVGKLAVAPVNCEPFVCSPQTTFWRVLNKQVIDPRFLYFYMCSRDFRRQLDSIKGETDMADYASLTAQRRFSVPIINIRLQRSIAAVLSALDEKIELNRQTNETLEAMARAIFKDWFVDFGPTRAKMDGRAPYLAPDIWSLFPDRIDDDGKPEGWRSQPLLELCELKRGYDLPSQRRIAGNIRIISSSGPTGWHSEAMASGPGIVTGRYGTIGQVFACESDFWPLNTTLYVRDFKGHPYWFVYHTLLGLDFTKYSDKAAVPGVNRNALHLERVTIPSPNLLRRFDTTVKPLMAHAATNTDQEKTLKSLRDLLLPKLMSGEIRINDADKILGDAL